MNDKPCPAKLPPVCKPKTESQEVIKIHEDAKAENEPHKPSESQRRENKKECKKIWHPGFDTRFPNQNQTRRCWSNYVDYIRCQSKFGPDYKPCEYYKKTFEYICPGFWIENWDEQRENGTFPMPKWA